MRRSVVLCNILAVLLCSGVALAQCPEPGVECIHMRLVPLSATYKLGKPIMINMVFTNQSDQDLPLGLIHAWDQGYGYHFEVTDVSTGKRLERTDDGKELAYETQGAPDPHPNKAIAPLIMGGGSIPLTPHETRTYPTILSSIFEFPGPGTYRVEVLRDGTKFQVAPLTITVVP